MKISSHPTPDEASAAAAGAIEQAAVEAVRERGRCVLALSGGSTPQQMLTYLVNSDMPWQHIWIMQVDERILPDGHPERNLTSLRHELIGQVPIPEKNVLAMPVSQVDLQRAKADYSQLLNQAAGSPPVIDILHLGLGNDGHTASLVPNDPLCQEINSLVGITGTYCGSRRMSLTFPVINRARRIVWLVTGAEKRPALLQLLSGDTSIPGAHVRRDQATLYTDQQLEDQTTTQDKERQHD